MEGSLVTDSASVWLQFNVCITYLINSHIYETNMQFKICCMAQLKSGKLLNFTMRQWEICSQNQPIIYMHSNALTEISSSSQVMTRESEMTATYGKRISCGLYISHRKPTHYNEPSVSRTKVQAWPVKVKQLSIEQGQQNLFVCVCAHNACADAQAWTNVFFQMHNSTKKSSL